MGVRVLARVVAPSVVAFVVISKGSCCNNRRRRTCLRGRHASGIAAFRVIVFVAAVVKHHTGSHSVIQIVVAGIAIIVPIIIEIIVTILIIIVLQLSRGG